MQGFKHFLFLLKNFIKANWGAPFIVAFMVLLSVAAVYLAMGMESLANDVAVYAYYNLVAGVVLQLISYVREDREENTEESNSR